MYTMTLADGTKLENLSKNGDNFISDTKIDETVFTDNLSTVTVSDGETETVMENVELIQQVQYADGKWYLAFREISADEIRNAQVDSKIEYIAMMANVDLEG